MIVFVCVSHAVAASSVAADSERVGMCELCGLFSDFAFPLEPASVVFLPN